MPTLTVRTTPIKAYVRIYRASGRYGIMTEGKAPVSYAREYPWDFVAAGFSAVVGGSLWVPEVEQIRGICEGHKTVTLRYFKLGPAKEYL